MLEGLIGLLGSATAGGLLGLAGSIFKGWEERKKMQLEFEHKEAMAEKRQEEIRLEADLAIKQTEAEYAGKQAIAETEAEAAIDVAASQLRAASYRHDRATYGGGWVDDVRGMMRPLITCYLLIVVSMIMWRLMSIDQIYASAPEEARALARLVVLEVVFLAASAVTWWFGTRPNSQPARQVTHA